MNRTGIDWADFSWSVATGCLHGCPWCYARSLAQGRMKKTPPYSVTGFKPTYHPKRINEPLGVRTPSTIFIGSMADVLGEWDWQVYHDGMVTGRLSGYALCENVAAIVAKAPHHSFIVLSKANFQEASVRERANFFARAGAWVGTSITGADKNAEAEVARLDGLACVDAWRYVVSFEPMIGVNKDTVKALYRLLDRVNSAVVKRSWVIVGGLTGDGHEDLMDSLLLRTPGNIGSEQVDSMVLNVQARGAKVFVKRNFAPMLQDMRDFPEGMVCQKGSKVGGPGLEVGND